MNGEENVDQRAVDQQRGALIESRFNVERAATIGVSLGGLDTRDMAQVLEYAKGMSLSGSMVPSWCRNQIWTCFGICIQALEWKMSPWSLARMAYEVENARTKERTVAYMSQVHHAVLESRAPLKERLRVRYEGEGDAMVCIVWGTFKGEAEAREWRSPTLGERRPKTQQRTGRGGDTYEVTPGSPLWQTKPLVQLFYDTSRDWARIYCPDVTLGIYTSDEMEDAGFETAANAALPAPDDGGLAARLTSSALARAGFPADQVVAAVDGALATRHTDDRRHPLSVDKVGDAGGGRAPSPTPAPPDPDPGQPDHGLTPASDEPATLVAETEEAGPRPSRARRRDPKPEMTDAASHGDGRVE